MVAFARCFDKSVLLLFRGVKLLCSYSRQQAAMDARIFQFYEHNTTKRRFVSRILVNWFNFRHFWHQNIMKGWIVESLEQSVNYIASARNAFTIFSCNIPHIFCNWFASKTTDGVAHTFCSRQMSVSHIHTHTYSAYSLSEPSVIEFGCVLFHYSNTLFSPHKYRIHLVIDFCFIFSFWSTIFQMATTDTIELPPLPANEKTYAGIPEAVFVVSSKSSNSTCANCVTD